jgi:sirohydrochlorin cobaltochelatase
VSTAVVFIAHGSRAAAANEAHQAAAAELAERLGLPVHAAFLELAEPSIPSAIVAAVDAGTEHVLVLPYFLYPGRHVATDIPELVAEARAVRPEASIEVLDAFGADPTVLGVLADQVRRAGLSSPLLGHEE